MFTVWLYFNHQKLYHNCHYGGSTMSYLLLGDHLQERKKNENFQNFNIKGSCSCLREQSLTRKFL